MTKYLPFTESDVKVERDGVIILWDENDPAFAPYERPTSPWFFGAGFAPSMCGLHTTDYEGDRMECNRPADHLGAHAAYLNGGTPPFFLWVS